MGNCITISVSKDSQDKVRTVRLKNMNCESKTLERIFDTDAFTHIPSNALDPVFYAKHSHFQE